MVNKNKKDKKDKKKRRGLFGRGRKVPAAAESEA